MLERETLLWNTQNIPKRTKKETENISNQKFAMVCVHIYVRIPQLIFHFLIDLGYVGGGKRVKSEPRTAWEELHWRFCCAKMDTFSVVKF